MKEDVEARTTGLTGRDHINIPAVATKSPADSDSGSACARGLEPWKEEQGLAGGACSLALTLCVSSMLLM